MKNFVLVLAVLFVLAPLCAHAASSYRSEIINKLASCTPYVYTHPYGNPVYDEKNIKNLNAMVIEGSQNGNCKLRIQDPTVEYPKVLKCSLPKEQVNELISFYKIVSSRWSILKTVSWYDGYTELWVFSLEHSKTGKKGNMIVNPISNYVDDGFCKVYDYK